MASTIQYAKESIADMLHRSIHANANLAALETPTETITYRKLGLLVEEFSSKIAMSTREGEFVGIRADRDYTSIVALIATIVSGRPFVFLDPRDHHSNVNKIELLGIRYQAETNSTTGALSLSELTFSAQKRVSPLYHRTREIGRDVMYGITTSGSTGKPKCVLVAPDSIAQLIIAHVNILQLGPHSRTLQFARLTFDGCITEILWSLTSGATLVMCKEDDLTPGAALQKTLEERRVTHLKTTPFALSVTAPSEKMSLTHVINGGGSCRPSTVRKWSSVSSVHNAYGLTETTICNFLSGPLTMDDCETAVPIGRYIGSGTFEIVPIDPTEPKKRGELVITGDDVALGYLTHSGIVAFNDDGALFRFATGDIVEEVDGELIYIERVDRQLKIRGFRIDPGEIENSACQLPGVTEAVVIGEKEHGNKSEGLSLYFQGSTTSRMVRSHLQRMLDSYKVPSSITLVSSFPYNVNGKLDKSALYDMRIDEASKIDFPSGFSESALAGPVLECVRRLTGVMDASLDDNFFDLGGDSASALVLTTELRDLGWSQVGVRDILRAPKIQALVSQAEAARG